MEKVYIITYKAGFDLEDCIFTTNWEKALEYLNKKPSQKNIIEYVFDSDGVSDFWNVIHFYKNGTLISEKTLK